MGLYRSAGGQGTPPATGAGMGAGLIDAELAAAQRFAEPTVPPQTGERLVTGTPGPGANEVDPSFYNLGPQYPVKYTVPTAQKERLKARQDIREAAGAATGTTVHRTDPITDEEVNYLQSMKDQAELADFDRYVNSLIDPRKPGNLKFLMEIYPEYVNRRIQQVHTDYEYALRNQMIDSWGINTFDDLHFKFLVDQGKINGPQLTTPRDLRDSYAAGALSPYAFAINGDRDRKDGLKLPFASAKYGKRPAGDDKELWALRDAGQPFSRGRTGPQLAKGIYGNVDGDDIRTDPADRLAAGMGGLRLI